MLEAAFQREYGIDLADACWGPEPMSVRRLLNLARALPELPEIIRLDREDRELEDQDPIDGIMRLFSAGVGQDPTTQKRGDNVVFFVPRKAG